MISGDPNIYILEVNASTPTSSIKRVISFTLPSPMVEPPSFDLILILTALSPKMKCGKGK